MSKDCLVKSDGQQRREYGPKEITYPLRMRMEVRKISFKGTTCICSRLIQIRVRRGVPDFPSDVFICTLCNCSVPDISDVQVCSFTEKIMNDVDFAKEYCLMKRSFSHKKIHVLRRLMILVHNGVNWSLPIKEELQDVDRIGLTSNCVVQNLPFCDITATT